MIKICIQIIILCSLIAITLQVGVKINNAKIYDLQNRQIRFHGPNVVMKVPPYIPIRNHSDPHRSFCKQDMLKLKGWGFNGIRLGMMWAGVEPEPNKYNETYLRQMEQLINEAGSYGIYTIIDFHQDLISEKYCGDGVPKWLIDQINGYRSFPQPIGKKIHLNSSGLPSWENCDQKNWGTYYFSYDVARTFNELYHIGSHLNKKFTQFWMKIATKFRNNKYVIAYQFINEPFVGNLYLNPALLIPSVAQKLKFQQFYDNLAQQIRKIDTVTPICFEPITFDQSIRSGFSHPPGGNRYQNLSIFCYHYYKPPALGFGTLDARLNDGKRLGIPSILNQFNSHSEQVMNFAQKNQQSWMFWDYKDFGKNWGSYQSDSSLSSVEGRIRTYMQRISGKLIRQSFNTETFQYVSSFQAVPNGVSILYFNRKQHYLNGPIISVKPKQQIQWKYIGQNCNQNVKQISVDCNYIQIKFTGDKSRLVQITLDSK